MKIFSFLCAGTGSSNSHTITSSLTHSHTHSLAHSLLYLPTTSTHSLVMPPAPRLSDRNNTTYYPTHTHSLTPTLTHSLTGGYGHFATQQLRLHPHTHTHTSFLPSQQVLKACQTNNFIWLSNLLKNHTLTHTLNTCFIGPATTGDKNKNKYSEFTVDTCDEDGWTGLHWASRNNNSQVLTVLVKAGADVNHTTHTGATALYLAVLYGNKEAAMLLLQCKGCNVNISSNDGTTPLMLACRFNHPALAEALLQAGASTSPRSAQGDDCLSLTTRNGHQEIVKILVNAGAVQFENSPEFKYALEVCKDEETKRLLISETRWFLRKPFLMAMKEGGVVGPSDRQSREEVTASHRKILPSSLQDIVFGNLYREVARYL